MPLVGYAVSKKTCTIVLTLLSLVVFSRLVAVAGLYTPFLLEYFKALYTNPVSGSGNPVDILKVRPGFTGRWLSGDTLLRLPCPREDGTVLVVRGASPENGQDVEAIVDGAQHFHFSLRNDALTDMRIPLPRQEAGGDCRTEVRFVSKTSHLPGDSRDLSFVIDTLAYEPCPDASVDASNGAIFVSGRTWPQYRDMVGTVVSDMTRVVLRGWDAAWYASVIDDGYHFRLENPQGQYNVNFFPLYPLLAKGVGLALGVQSGTALIVLANVLFLVAVGFLYFFVATRYDHEAAMTAATALCFFPGAFFFSLPYSESLMLLLTILFLLAADKKQWWLAAVWAGLASATRMIGVSFAVVFAYRAFRERAWRSWPATLRLVGQGLVSCAGFLLYSAYQWYAFGMPFAASHATKEAWKVPTADWITAMLTGKPFFTLIRELVDNPFSAIHLSNTNILLFLCVVLVGLVMARKLGPVATIVIFSQLFLVYMSFAGMNLFSTTRYCAVIAPFFIGLGLLFSRPLKAYYPLLVAYFTLSLYLLAFFWTAGILS